jgi:hypothetical protein
MKKLLMFVAVAGFALATSAHNPGDDKDKDKKKSTTETKACCKKDGKGCCKKGEKACAPKADTKKTDTTAPTAK